MQSTLIGCGGISKFNVAFVMGHFDWPSTKTSNISNAPQIKAFTINKEVRKCFMLPYIHPIQAQTFGQRIWDKL